jgi:hypothetical protein
VSLPERAEVHRLHDCGLGPAAIARQLNVSEPWIRHLLTTRQDEAPRLWPTLRIRRPRQRPRADC